MPSATYTPGSGFGIVASLATSTTLLGNIHGYRPAKVDRPAIETTHMATTGGHQTFIAGDLKNWGEIEIDVEYNTQLDYKTLLTSQAAENMTITFPLRGNAATAATCVFSAVLTAMSPTWPKDDLLMVTMTFKVSGSPTYTAATT